MAAGGVAFTGGTGEDYAISGRNAVVLETLDPAEIVSRWSELAAAPELSARLRRSARRTARDYKWRTITAVLIDSLSREARRQGLIARPLAVERTEVKPEPRRQFDDVRAMSLATTRPVKSEWRTARADDVAMSGV
jgi:hypothetical protein